MTDCVAVSYSEKKQCLLLSGFTSTETDNGWTSAQCPQSAAAATCSCIQFEDQKFNFLAADRIEKKKAATIDLCRDDCLQVSPYS